MRNRISKPADNRVMFDKDVAEFLGISIRTLTRRIEKPLRGSRTTRTRASSGAAVCGCAQKSSGLSESGQQKGSETMMITQQQMMMVLERHEPWSWVATVWQKLTNGKLVKFIDWSWKHR